MVYSFLMTMSFQSSVYNICMWLWIQYHLMVNTSPPLLYMNLLVRGHDIKNRHMIFRGFTEGRAPGNLTGCEHDFAHLLSI